MTPAQLVAFYLSLTPGRWRSPARSGGAARRSSCRSPASRSSPLALRFCLRSHATDRERVFRRAWPSDCRMTIGHRTDQADFRAGVGADRAGARRPPLISVGPGQRISVGVSSGRVAPGLADELRAALGAAARSGGRPRRSAAYSNNELTWQCDDDDESLFAPDRRPAMALASLPALAVGDLKGARRESVHLQRAARNRGRPDLAARLHAGRLHGDLLAVFGVCSIRCVKHRKSRGVRAANFQREHDGRDRLDDRAFRDRDRHALPRPRRRRDEGHEFADLTIKATGIQ